MSNCEVLKCLKNSYENILFLLKESKLSQKQSNDLQKVIKTLKELYNSTYLKTVDNDKNDLITNACCKNCNNKLLISDNIEYSYQCEECDENFYDFETIKYKEEKKSDEKLNSSFYLQLSYDNETKEVYIGTESSSGAKYNCVTIKELVSSVNEYCNNYLNYDNELTKESDYEI